VSNVRRGQPHDEFETYRPALFGGEADRIIPPAIPVA
jgi:hypothetical protein